MSLDRDDPLIVHLERHGMSWRNSCSGTAEGLTADHREDHEEPLLRRPDHDHADGNYRMKGTFVV